MALSRKALYVRWKELIRRDGRLIEQAPEEVKDFGMYLEVVKSPHNLLHLVPIEHRTKELCELAFQVTSATIYYIPDEHITVQMALKAVACNGYVVHALPERVLTFEVCRMASATNKETWSYVPSHLKNFF